MESTVLFFLRLWTKVQDTFHLPINDNDRMRDSVHCDSTEVDYIGYGLWYGKLGAHADSGQQNIGGDCSCCLKA